MTEEQKPTDLAEFSKTEAGLAELRTKYAIVPDAKTAEGYEKIKDALREIVPIRTGLDKLRLQLNADDQARIKARNDEAKRIAGEIAKIEDPLQAAKKAVDDEQRRIAEEARKREEERIAGITTRIDRMRAAGDSLLGADSGVLAKRITGLEAVDPSEGFGEYAEAAAQVRDDVLDKLRHAHAERVKFEAQQREAERIAAEQAARQKELDAQAEQLKAEQEARQKKIDEEAAELKRQQEEAARQQAEAAAELEAEKTALRAEAERLEKAQRVEKTPYIPVKPAGKSGEYDDVDAVAIAEYIDALRAVTPPRIMNPETLDRLNGFVQTLQELTDGLRSDCKLEKVA